jgi:hypothetical protein
VLQVPPVLKDLLEQLEQQDLKEIKVHRVIKV